MHITTTVHLEDQPVLSAHTGGEGFIWFSIAEQGNTKDVAVFCRVTDADTLKRAVDAFNFQIMLGAKEKEAA